MAVTTSQITITTMEGWHSGDSAPSNALVGDLWLDTTDNKIKKWNGTQWELQADAQGPQGDKGDSITSRVAYWIKSSTKPAKPNSNSISNWNEGSEPPENALNNIGETDKFWRVYKETYSNGNITYSEVEKIGSYEVLNGLVQFRNGITTTENVGGQDVTVIDGGKIKTGSIAANKIDIDDLQTHIARIGDANSKHVLIDSSGTHINDGGNELAAFSANKIELGKNSPNAQIELCGGKTVMRHTSSDSGLLGGGYQGFVIEELTKDEDNGFYIVGEKNSAIGRAITRTQGYTDRMPQPNPDDEYERATTQIYAGSEQNVDYGHAMVYLDSAPTNNCIDLEAWSSDYEGAGLGGGVEGSGGNTYENLAKLRLYADDKKAGCRIYTDLYLGRHDTPIGWTDYRTNSTATAISSSNTSSWRSVKASLTLPAGTYVIKGRLHYGAKTTVSGSTNASAGKRSIRLCSDSSGSTGYDRTVVTGYITAGQSYYIETVMFRKFTSDNNYVGVQPYSTTAVTVEGGSVEAIRIS